MSWYEAAMTAYVGGLTLLGILAFVSSRKRVKRAKHRSSRGAFRVSWRGLRTAGSHRLVAA